MSSNFNCGYMAMSSLTYIKQQWTIEEISIFSNNSHLEWRAGLSDTILKGTHPTTIPARFDVIFYQNMPNLHNQYKSAERKTRNIYMLNYSLPCRDGRWVGPFQNCVRQPRPPFKMAIVTKNRNFFNCPLLL
jgi:hypothetical protein